MEDHSNGVGKPKGYGIKTNSVKAPKQINKNPAKNKAVGKAARAFITVLFINLYGNNQTGTETSCNSYAFKNVFWDTVYYIHAIRANGFMY